MSLGLSWRSCLGACGPLQGLWLLFQAMGSYQRVLSRVRTWPDQVENGCPRERDDRCPPRCLHKDHSAHIYYCDRSGLRGRRVGGWGLSIPEDAAFSGELAGLWDRKEEEEMVAPLLMRGGSNMEDDSSLFPTPGTSWRDVPAPPEGRSRAGADGQERGRPPRSSLGAAQRQAGADWRP